MNKILALLSCFIFVSALAGCGRQNGKMSGHPQLGGETWEDAFPDFLVGVWEAEAPGGHEWGFKFERDGSISKIVHFFAGEVDLREEGTYLEGPEPGTYATFVMGPCEADYNPTTREVRVKIILDYYQIVLSQEQLEGSAYDFFLGPVSEDGTIWTALWKHLSWLEGADSPEPNSPSVQLTFTKVDNDQ